MTDRVSSREQPRDEGMKGLARSSGYHTVLLAINIGKNKLVWKNIFPRREKFVENILRYPGF